MKQDFWRQRFEEWGEKTAIIRGERRTTYCELLALISHFRSQIVDSRIGERSVVLLRGDYDSDSIALLIALFAEGIIVAPVTNLPLAKEDEFVKIAEAGCVVSGKNSQLSVEKTGLVVVNPLTAKLIESKHPGIILFSSGSTGKPKASLHDAYKLLNKFVTPHRALVTVAMPPFDHIAGLDSLFYTLTSGGTLVCPEVRSPDAICKLIAEYEVELLPCSATFLRLLMVSDVPVLPSVKIIAYGSDVMPQDTLSKLKQIFPMAKLLQKYGTTELGSPPTHSMNDQSLWMKIDSPDFEIKIVDGILFIRSQSAMLGYLNAPSPFDADGWLNTQDMVEVDGDYFRILGRKSDIINVGGEKVYPLEVENLILQMADVVDVTVCGESNPIMGNMVVAKVALASTEDLLAFKSRMTAYLKDKVEPFKIPVKIVSLDKSDEHGDRFKKKRAQEFRQEGRGN